MIAFGEPTLVRTIGVQYSLDIGCVLLGELPSISYDERTSRKLVSGSVAVETLLVTVACS